MSSKPWDKKGVYATFEEADEVRHLFLDSAEEMQAKVRRTAEGKFLVKTRTHPDFEPKKEKKKSGKNRRRNKKNTDRRMYDASADF
jgi:hypothetical protein